ncbi:bZIP transcription factor 50 [Linum grandiflorum]
MENDDILGQIDWDNLEGLLENGSEFDIFHQVPDAAISSLPNSAPDSSSFQMEEIENLLMRDEGPGDVQLDDDFLAQFLVDSPTTPPADASSSPDPDLPNSSSSSRPDSSDKDNDRSLAAGSPHPHLGVEDDDDDNDDTAPNDPVSKKRRRQLRNRDAAVRSRERKKMYVKDLEMKSKYLESECRRLGRLLQCCVAENQALRFSLHNGNGVAAYGATSARQESAVLLLESLLLGSLLWFLGIMCLFALPTVAQLRIPLLEPKDESRKEGNISKMATPHLGEPFLVRGRRCKASRTRMKLRYLYSSCLGLFYCNCLLQYK